MTMVTLLIYWNRCLRGGLGASDNVFETIVGVVHQPTVRHARLSTACRRCQRQPGWVLAAAHRCLPECHRASQRERRRIRQRRHWQAPHCWHWALSCPALGFPAPTYAPMAVALLHRVIGLSQSHNVITHYPQCLGVLTHTRLSNPSARQVSHVHVSFPRCRTGHQLSGNARKQRLLTLLTPSLLYFSESASTRRAGTSTRGRKRSRWRTTRAECREPFIYVQQQWD